MAKIKVSSDFGFEFEAEESGFSEDINRSQVLGDALDAMTLEADKYIPAEIEGREESKPAAKKPAPKPAPKPKPKKK